MATKYGVRPPGYRLPDETHIGKVRLQVASLDRSIDYYEKVIGMRVINQSAASAQLGPHGDDRVLIQLDEKKTARTRPAFGRMRRFAIVTRTKTSETKA